MKNSLKDKVNKFLQLMEYAKFHGTINQFYNENIFIIDCQGMVDAKHA